jgi:anti-sigma factor RsiW
MKPCSKNRKLIAGLALDELDPRQANDLRAHLESCEGCRRYWKEIFSVTQKLTAVQTASDIQVSESFHQRLVGRLRAEETASAWDRMVTSLRAALMNPRVALPVVGAAAAMLVLTFVIVRRSETPPTAPIVAQSVPAHVVETDLQPTVANYQMAVNKSFEKLDELLTRQGNWNPSPTPIYTASTFLRADALD